VFKRISEKIKKKAQKPNGYPDFERLSDETFLDYIYKKLLGREPDPHGKAVQLKFLREGNSRVSLLLNIIEAPEFVYKIVRDNIHAYIQVLPIKDEKPDHYQAISDLERREKTWVFRVKEENDFDWLERKVIENGYYERPGVWSFIIDEDKQILAEMASEFNPRSVLDFGCANGAVLKCLKDRGIHGEGVEISRMALDKAFPDIRDEIHFGDLLNLSLPQKYDLVLGLDIFEHLNPHKLAGTISKIHGLLHEGGYLLANIPAFGRDKVFGEIFRVNYKDWEDDIAKARCFRTIPVDDYGYPKNGHIICADTDWWVSQFESVGWRRETELERAFHQKYNAPMEKITPARKSYYLFSKNADTSKNQALVKKLRS